MYYSKRVFKTFNNNLENEKPSEFSKKIHVNENLKTQVLKAYKSLLHFKSRMLDHEGTLVANVIFQMKNSEVTEIK